jgi:hypothetical protein
LHRKGPSTLRQGPQVCRVSEHPGQGSNGFDHGDLPFGGNGFNRTLSRLQITHHLTHEFFRNDDIHLHHRFHKNGLSLSAAFPQGIRRGNLQRQRGWMIQVDVGF